MNNRFFTAATSSASNIDHYIQLVEGNIRHSTHERIWLMKEKYHFQNSLYAAPELITSIDEQIAQISLVIQHDNIRLEALRKIKDSQIISNAEHELLLKAKLFKSDPSIANYLLVKEKESKVPANNLLPLAGTPKQ